MNHSIYDDPRFADHLEDWGSNTVWPEIMHLMALANGKALDMGCGTGNTMRLLERDGLEVHGFDISRLMISKAISNGVLKERLIVRNICNGFPLPYNDNTFDWAYSIGSLEHFTLPLTALRECIRVTRLWSFHQIPVTLDGLDHDWRDDVEQPGYYNSEKWWKVLFTSIFGLVLVLPSKWSSPDSVGRWFICRHEQ